MLGADHVGAYLAAGQFLQSERAVLEEGAQAVFLKRIGAEMIDDADARLGGLGDVLLRVTLSVIGNRSGMDFSVR